jgi:hypothetical protein
MPSKYSQDDIATIMQRVLDDAKKNEAKDIVMPIGFAALIVKRLNSYTDTLERLENTTHNSVLHARSARIPDKLPNPQISGLPKDDRQARPGVTGSAAL